MNFGFVLPFGDARAAAEAAREAERAGWDGLFVWEPVWGIDAWVQLTAAAMLTERIKLGTMITPLSRMRPWKLASEMAALDRLSNGRVILSVGLGAVDTGFEQFGEVTDRKTRAELLDEGLEILTGLWKGQPFNFEGAHYKIRETTFFPPPPPVQKPRIPIWVVGAWRREKSMQRVVKYDGLLPNKMNAKGKIVPFTPADVREMKAYVMKRRKLKTPFDIVVEGATPGDKPKQAAANVRKWAENGATWWIEAMWTAPRDGEGMSRVMERVRRGPPKG
ncbi:MAG: LLM class flavin-dependent oxidoreductase [Chloroflexi bacterium]|nr:LLM class flavin-dependent oxidoreductase [Chloroflexota bacterium]